MEFSTVFNEQQQTWTVQRVVGPKGKKRCEPWVTIRQSTIVGAGDGVFADRDFGKGVVLDYYTGAICDEIDDALYNGKYAMGVDDDNVLDAARSGSWSRKINDGRSLGLQNNVVFSDPRIAVKTRRAISKGEELLIGYGDEYWECFGSK